MTPSLSWQLEDCRSFVAAMCSKIISSTTTTTVLGQASGGSSGGRSRSAVKRLSPGKPKRTTFTCVACGRTFPTQQAMAGHSSIHSRARLNDDALASPAVVNPVPQLLRTHHGLRRVHGHVPAMVNLRPSYLLPFVHRHHYMMSNQLHGTNTPPPAVTVLDAATAFQTVAHPVQVMQVGWGPLYHYYTLLPPRYTASVPVQSHASSAHHQQVPVDAPSVPVQSHAFSGASGGSGAQRRRMFQSFVANGAARKTAVAMDGGDQGGQGSKDWDGSDLELRLGF